jgi:hypothetical protein
MNFQDLMSKLQAIEENTEMPTDECGGMPVAIGHTEQPKQQDNVTMNVSMNGSGAGGIKDLMSILRNIEAGAEHGEDDVVFGEPGDEHGHAEPIIDVDMDEVYGNSPAEQTTGIDAVTPTGDDMASKGAEAPKVNGGGNPMQESLVSKLSQMYEEIKGGPIGGAVDLGNQRAGQAYNYAALKSTPEWKQLQANLEAAVNSGDPESPALAKAMADIKAFTTKMKVPPMQEAEVMKTMSRAAKGNEKYGKDGMKALAKAGREGKDLDKVRDKHDKYDESVSQMLALNKVLNG